MTGIATTGIAQESGQTEAQSPKINSWAQVAVMTALYAAMALLCAKQGMVADTDVWWHLKSAEWIEQHGTVPHTDSFSLYRSGTPWAAYSWLYELLLLRLYRWLGLTGLLAYSSCMIAAIAAALHKMIRGLQGDFTLGILLTLAGSMCMMRIWTPRSWLFTILFFVLVLDTAMEARRNGRMSGLYWLPLVFVLWANIHLQFVVGLLVLVVALGESLLARFAGGVGTRVGPVRMALVLAACALATLVNPYGWHIYGVVAGVASQSGVMDTILELKSLPFRDGVDFGILFLALGAFAALGWARRIQPFETALMIFAAMVSFRSLRDLWLVVAMSCAVLAAGVRSKRSDSYEGRWFDAPIVVAATGMLVLLGFHAFHIDNRSLDAKVRETLPVGASEFVKARGLTGPLYNDIGWGGYLIWSLGMPVEVDGRTNVYGDLRLNRSVATWSAERDWDADEDLHKAGLVIGPSNEALSQVLRLSPEFELVYDDKVAAVFVARKPNGAMPARSGASPGRNQTSE